VLVSRLFGYCMVNTLHLSNTALTLHSLRFGVAWGFIGYTGLSALLHGVIVWGAIKDVTVGLKSGYILFIGVWIKLILEQVNGPSAEIGQLIQSTVAVDAHLIGAIGGVILAVPLVVKHIKNDTKHS